MTKPVALASPLFSDSSAVGAHHYQQSTGLGASSEALDWARRAAADAAGRFAHDEEIRWLQRAVEIEALLQPLDALRRIDLLIDLGEARLRPLRYEQGDAMLNEALMMALTVSSPDRFAPIAPSNGHISTRTGHHGRDRKGGLTCTNAHSPARVGHLGGDFNPKVLGSSPRRPTFASGVTPCRCVWWRM